MEELHDCVVQLRSNPQRCRDTVYVGCGAGFGGDRPMAALKLLERVKELNYLVLECLAERTLVDRYQIMMSGGKGYDPRVKEWLSVLLPLALDRGVCIITNMGAVDPLGAQEEVLELASNLGLEITVAVAYETSSGNSVFSNESTGVRQGGSTYLGVASIVHCLENGKPQVVITSRVADAALFLAPMVYELGWNWNDFEELSQGTLASHLLECGCQLTGGYFMHPGDAYRDFSFEQLLDLSLPYAEVSYKGEVFVGKAEGSGGLLSYSTCAEQLLYEVGDPANYITPDLVVDFRDVKFQQISKDKVQCKGAKPSNPCWPEKLLQLLPTESGWKGWGEISYGGQECLKRAHAAEYLVRSWMDETYPGIEGKIISYIIGYDSLKAIGDNKDSSVKQVMDVRFRMDGLFELEEHAIKFVEEFIALYTNGPAGGGGISTGQKKEITLQKILVDREKIFWQVNMKKSSIPSPQNQATNADKGQMCDQQQHKCPRRCAMGTLPLNTNMDTLPSAVPSPSGTKIPLYHVAHSRAGDKGNDLNFSIIPHFPDDIGRLRAVITRDWVKNAVSPLLDSSLFPADRANQVRYDPLENVSIEIYDVPGISSLNVVVRNILDGGVNSSRRIDRHGKTLSDLILCQNVVLPP
ncbi:uncharacterized protein [Oryza sativa Japonica Group]|uniref:Os07g0457300 protein n=2 Tax=Oryza sativa subsp. japonica TaxID=39947 RepID=Q7EY96_ORYSJ|nr:uncharacterized protein LOC4343149 [Oryza sativa Japonica Group]XP_015644903.1 uncharacterized protein LOC4343149 [Oryza sativa Japonica Group]XP_015644904.1 uncharacterized protein LOC4343149 [Oryza sativa Japonica Group]KAB8105295.1 hypothetical protein EE612_038997 [Oryza sativa]KAF2922668.1 hypothetical protein DAI22_07g130500 [Oryza sativa Japonica Group]KAF2922669.1 hypothetical protein DAI22_07g130500 [Oryza sativa Japonica Group]BAC84385.1 unknown protein [Oryza sativa Japonica Gro|eukprot:NP_001059563.1 Os07g0457300 [Oryza sativa Japonica Group]